MEITKQFQKSGVDFIAVSVDDSKSDATKHLKQTPFEVATYYDKDQLLKTSLLLPGVPVIIVYNRKHEQAMRFSGYTEKKEAGLKKLLSALAKE